jgi:hypothetical protein
MQVFVGTSLPTVLYIFSPTCGWCARNLSNIRALAAARSSSFRFIGLSLSGPKLKDYAANTRLGFPIFEIKSYAAIKGLPLGGTPQTLVVSPTGRVIKNWPGAFMGDQETQVEEYFGVKLPGLSTPLSVGKD